MAYLFDPDRLEQLTKPLAGLPHHELVRQLPDVLAQAYPGHIDPRPRPLFNVAGGAAGMMYVLHGSLSEYLILFGTPIGTEGYSGRFTAEIHDLVLLGEMWTYTEEHPGEHVTSRPGDHAVLRVGQAKGWSAKPGTWMLEYGRGFIPGTLPIALSDVLIGACDVVTVARTFWTYGRLIVRELLQGKL